MRGDTRSLDGGNHSSKERERVLQPLMPPRTGWQVGAHPILHKAGGDHCIPSREKVATLWLEVAGCIQQRFAMQLQATMVEVLKVPDMDGFPGLLGAGLTPEDKGGPLVLHPAEGAKDRRSFTIECRLSLLEGKAGVIKLKHEANGDPPGWALWGSGNNPERGIRLGQLIRVQGPTGRPAMGRAGASNSKLGWLDLCYGSLYLKPERRWRPRGGRRGQPQRHRRTWHLCHQQRIRLRHRGRRWGEDTGKSFVAMWP